MNQKRKRMFTRRTCTLFLAVCLTVFWSLPVFAEEPDSETPDTSLTPTEQPGEQTPPDNGEAGENFFPEPNTAPEEPGSNPMENPGEEDVSSDGETFSEQGEEAEEPSDFDPVQLPEYEEKVIDVIVPPQGEMIINPYHLKTDVEGIETYEQIFNPAQTLINRGDFPVSVNVHISGFVPGGSDAVLINHFPEFGTEEKEVFLYAEFQNEMESWINEYTGAPNQVLVTEEGSDCEDVLTLAPNSEGYFRIFGAMAEMPAELWEKGDTFDVSLSFSFAVVDDIQVTQEEPEAPTEQGEGEETLAPVEPEDPSNPLEPNDPSLPSEPVDMPEEPSEPMEPVEPTEPDPPENLGDPDQSNGETTPPDQAETEEPGEPTEPEVPSSSELLPELSESQTQPDFGEAVNPDTV